MVNSQAGKGDKYRPIDPVKWNEGWEKAFGKKKTKKIGTTEKSTSKGKKNV
jgi:hypothetical protein